MPSSLPRSTLRLTSLACCVILTSAACGEPAADSPSGGGGSSQGQAGSSGAAAGGSGSSGGPGAGGGAGAAAGGASQGGSATASGGAGQGGTSAPGGGTGGSPPAGGSAGVAGAPAVDDCEGAPALDAALLGDCSGTSPITCLFGGNPGHYDVRVLLGGETAGSTVVQAESRRFFTGEVATAAQEPQCLSFTVNVRSPEGQPIQATAPEGIAGLNLRLVGDSPLLSGVGVAPAASPIVLYIAGDSTVCDQDPQYDIDPEARFSGWGQLLPQFFVRGVSVTNYADSGEGTAAFRTDGGGLWARIDDELKAGDFVFIKLGHNDKTTPAATYRSRITGMVTATKGKGATPVLVTPIVRNNGAPLDEQHIYGDLVVRDELQQIAASEDVPLIDLMAMTSDWVDSVGRTTAQTYFVGTDSTHTNELGAQVFAELVVSGILDQGLSIGSYLR